jgi:hypothetical protein
MGDSLRAVQLGTGRSAVALALGLFHSCALLDDASVKCWGYNSRGQLGLGDTPDRGDDGGEMDDSLPAVDLGRAVVQIAAGSFHTCALLDDGQLYAPHPLCRPWIGCSAWLERATCVDGPEGPWRGGVARGWGLAPPLLTFLARSP